MFGFQRFPIGLTFIFIIREEYTNFLFIEEGGVPRYVESVAKFMFFRFYNFLNTEELF